MRCAVVVAFACASCALGLSLSKTTEGTTDDCEAVNLKETEQAEQREEQNCNCQMLSAMGCAAHGAKSIFAHRPGCYTQCCSGLAYKPLSFEEKERGTKPLGYEGSRTRLRNKLYQSLQGKALKVVVLGGSMTEGTGTSDKDKKRWSAELERRLKDKLVTEVTVINRAIPASTSMTPLVHLEEIIADQPDIVLVDYAINDAVPDAGLHATEAEKKKSTKFVEVTNTLARTLLDLPTEPAVAYLETFTHDTLFGYNCKTSVKEFPHWAPLQDLEVPVVSYTEAACAPGVKTEEIWDMNAYTPTNGPQHPKDAVHKRLGALMAHFILDNTKEACKSGAVAAPRNLKVKIQDKAENVLVKCAAETTSKLDPLFDSKKGKWMTNIRNLYELPRKVAHKNFPAHVGDSAWQFLDDRSNDGWFQGMPKFGWIAKEGKDGKIAFDVKSSGKDNSAVLMEYLSSYDTAKNHMGKATCWFDKYPEASITIDSKVEQQVSLSDVAVIKFPKGTEAGDHKLVCKSDGKKFKILSLRSC